MTACGKRIEREKATVEAMVQIYCSDKHGNANLCKKCSKLLKYAQERLDRCAFGEDKPTCAKCLVHCYKAPQRAKMKEVMGYAGPKMLKKHPYFAVMHLLDGFVKPLSVKELKEKKKTGDPESPSYKTQKMMRITFFTLLVLSLLTFFISGSALLLNAGILFLLLIMVNDRKYEDLKRQELSKFDKFIGAALVVIPISLFLMGRFLLDTSWPDDNFGSFDYIVMILGLTVLFWGMGNLRKFFLPFVAAVALVLVWYLIDTTLFVEYIGPPFIKAAVYFTGGLLDLLGYDITSGGVEFVTPGGTIISVMIYCSGINGILLYILLMFLLLWNMNLKPWQKGLVILGGAVGQFFVNILRLTILMIIAIEYNADVMDTFHNGLGDLLFVVFFGLVYFGVMWWVGRKEGKDEEDVEK